MKRFGRSGGGTSTDSETTTTAASPGRRRSSAQVRTTLSRVLWGLCALLAVVLALGALLVALDANRDNALVDAVVSLADKADLSVFSRTNGVFTFDGADAEARSALVNWGLAAVAWLIIGRVVERVVRP